MKGIGLMWKDLSIQDIEAYVRITDSQERLNLLQRVAAEGLPEDPERADIVLDLYYYALQFGIERAFTADKLSVLFSIVKLTFEESMRNFLPAKASFNFFRDLLLQHSVHRPPFSIGLFVLQDVTAITEFVSLSFLRHYMLYKYCFTRKTEMAFSTISTYTLAPVDDLPREFWEPLSAAEDEVSKLKREEEAALAALADPSVEVTQAELDSAKVPLDLQDEVLTKVNEQLAQMKGKMEKQMEEQRQAMEARIEALQSQLRGT